MPSYSESPSDFVPESRIGFWFLGTNVWTMHVLQLTLLDFERLISKRRPVYPVVLDVGCGQGKAFRLLQERFSPQHIIGVDAEQRCVDRARAEAARADLSVEIQRGDVAAIDLPDASVDLLFCHQTFHHLTRQEPALREFYRVLKPGGLLLFAESTRAYIRSWIIRLFFRHPMDVQRSAEEYLDMIRAQGFQFGPENLSLPYLWWSRSDLGAFEWFGFPVPQIREETLVYVAATKPPATGDRPGER